MLVWVRIDKGHYLKRSILVKVAHLSQHLSVQLANFARHKYDLFPVCGLCVMQLNF
jgi:hypothetical protein